MIKLLDKYDLYMVEDEILREHAEKIMDEVMNYSAVDSLESVGAIFVLESEDDLNHPKLFGLSMPITESRFEWIDPFMNAEYMDGVIVIDNERTISIIGKSEYFKHIMEE